MSGRAPQYSQEDPEDAQKRHDKDPWKKLKEKPGVKVKHTTRRRGR